MAVDDRFSAVDYVVFSIMLLISALIGVWYGCGPGGKQKTTAEYLLGDRQMKKWPVAISLLVSFLSAITILGLPGEIYTYGTQFYVVILSYVLVCAAVSTVYIPMFRRIKITSVNEVSYISFAPITGDFSWGWDDIPYPITNNMATIIITKKRFCIIFRKKKTKQNKKTDR